MVVQETERPVKKLLPENQIPSVLVSLTVGEGVALIHTKNVVRGLNPGHRKSNDCYIKSKAAFTLQRKREAKRSEQARTEANGTTCCERKIASQTVLQGEV